MLPGNVDPRRADKQQRYKPPPSSTNATPGEDLTPDYMNILGPETTNPQTEKILQTSNNTDKTESSASAKLTTDEGKKIEDTKVVSEPNSAHVIPTSPQYGVAILPTANGDEAVAVETAVEAKPETIDTKEMHSTPSRNDRFKVVKIESTEPFRRGRWKCMDYLDQTFNQQTPKSLSTQSTGQQQTGTVYMQTQSLPPQQIQQMLIQSGYNAQAQAQFFAQQNGSVPQQMVGQQFCYPQIQNQNMQNMQPQTLNSNQMNQMIGAALNQPMMMQNSIQPQYVNTAQQQQQQYLPAGVLPVSVGYSMPANFQNLQFVAQPTTITQTANSAFVSASNNQINQLPSNLMQGQTYAGQQLQAQQNFVQQAPQQQGQTYAGQNLQNQMPMVNGHGPPTNQYMPEVPNLQSHVTKNVILNTVSNQPSQNSVVDQQISQHQNQQQLDLQQQQHQNQNASFPQQNNQTSDSSMNNNAQNVLLNATPDMNMQHQQPHQHQQQPQPVQQHQHQDHQQQVFIQQVVATTGVTVPNSVQQQNFQHHQHQQEHQNVYTTNPSFVANVASAAPVSTENFGHESSNVVEAVNEVSSTVEVHPPEEDPSKINPVVNAIDNKIEQAMDLVKSHLMFTVREEVIVLKEKIAELMDRIQQLETENNFLRSQIAIKPSNNPPESQ